MTAAFTDIKGKNILVTGAAKRIGRHLALALAGSGANVIIHHGHSPSEAESTREEIESLGCSAWVLAADLNEPDQAQTLIPRAAEFGPLYALINNASIFGSLSFTQTTLDSWQNHMSINLTAPFLLSQAFAASLPSDQEGRIVNILDWRALRPGADHFPYTISKAALASLNQSMAIALAPRITVNALALGAILPPEHNPGFSKIIDQVPAARWATLDEVSQALLFLLTGPKYITGEIIHIDGGRHLV